MLAVRFLFAYYLYVDSVSTDIPFKELILLQRKHYRSYKPVHCAILKQRVVFNAQGFEHLHMDGRKRRRNEKDARARLYLMDYAQEAIRVARMYKKDIKPAEVTHSQKQEIYYELYAVVGPDNIAVVATLRKIGKGSLHFYGVCYKRKKTTK